MPQGLGNVRPAQNSYMQDYAKSFLNGINPINGIGEQISAHAQEVPGPQIPIPDTSHAVQLAAPFHDTVTPATLSGVTPLSAIKRPR